MNRRDFLKVTSTGTLGLVSLSNIAVSKNKDDSPNIVYILADDMGYGDIEALNENCKIPTPHLNNLAKTGMTFTDAHSGSAVCTPTRYGILTGRYNWRSRLKAGVLAGYSPALIEEKRMTVASFLKNQGYSTACVGKWHLGWNWATKGNYEYSDGWNETGEHVDYNEPVTNGPRSIGFDYNFCIPASLDIVPYVYLENDKVVAPPSKIIEEQDGYGFYRSGPTAKGFVHEQVMPTFTEKSISWIKKQSRKKAPFFLYFPLSAPHTPILPTKKFQGKSGIGPYGDFVMQCDWTVGQIIKTLKENDVYKNTLVIFTSDNGCSPMANYKHLEEQGHDPSYLFRGHKADIFEGGHRIPFIASWPNKVRGNSTCNDVTCLTDLLATVADISGKILPDDAGEDSVSMLPNLLETAEKPLREATVHHSINGSFSIRQGKWKLQFCPGSGGWSDPVPAKAKAQALSKLQLYDLSNDIAETTNLADQYPKVIYELSKLMEKYVRDGRSTPGKPQPNNGKVDFWKHTLIKKEDLVKEVNHIALNKSITANIPPRRGNISNLTDGKIGSLNFADGIWTGYEGKDAEIIVDLEKSGKFNSLKIGFLQDQESYIFLPKSVKIEYSDNGKKYKALQTVNHETKKISEKFRRIISVKNKNLKTRYIRLSIESIKTCPKWHHGKGSKAWFFMDEIIVN